MKALLERARLGLARPAAVAWKDLLIFGKQATGWKEAMGALVLLSPLVAAAAVMAESPGPWRHGAHAIALAVAAVFSMLSFSVTVAAATSVALERDRDTLPALVVSPLTPGELILGKLMASVANALATKGLVLPALAIAYTMGGVEAGFIPRFGFVLLAADVSFASFALALSSRPLRPPRLGSPALKLGVSQAQLALQRSVAFSVLGSLLPMYASILGIPLVLQQGVPLARWLEKGGALAAVHPLFTLVAWGTVRLYGHEVPVWVCAVGFHLLLALPLLASAAESQRASGAERGRLPRLGFAIWFAYIVAVVAGAFREQEGETGALVVGALGGGLLVFAALGASLAAPRRRSFGRREILRALVDPRRAALSAPETAPGGVFLLGVVLGVFIVSCSGSSSAAFRAALGLGVATCGIAVLGARMASRAQARDTAAFERAVSRPRGAAGAPAEPASEGEQTAEPPTGASTVFSVGFVFLLLGPLLAALGIALGRGALPQLLPFEPVFRGLAIIALAANPFAALLPLVDSGSPLGALLVTRMQTNLGVEPATVASFGLVLWALVIVVALGTLRRAHEVTLESESAAR